LGRFLGALRAYNKSCRANSQFEKNVVGDVEHLAPHQKARFHQIEAAILHSRRPDLPTLRRTMVDEKKKKLQEKSNA
jgi:outer membrane PBP1 activator LpoA protein